MSRLQNNDVVAIVGGGVIGLSTAYNLAQRCSNSTWPNVRIKVIEAFSKPFTAASSTCTGCFHYGFPESQTQPLKPLGKYSFDLWAAEAEEADFKATTGYRPQSCFGINPGSGQGLDELPDWVQKASSWNVDTEVLGTYNAVVNPTGVGGWLTSQCLALGVEILTGLRLVHVSLSTDDKVQAVTCYAKGGDPAMIRIECKQVLLACGPWTPTVYVALFPSSPIHLQWTTDAGDWVTIKNPCPTTQATTAFVSFANLIGEKLEFAARNDGTIWACGRRTLTAALPPPGHLNEPDESVIEELSDRARTWLNWKCNCHAKHASNDFQLISKGRGFRPAAKSGLPTIDEVASSELTDSHDGQGPVKKSPSGVFVCWGHGSYGLTLGMGTGRLVSQLLLGEKPDLDLSLFALHPSSNGSTASGKASSALPADGNGATGPQL